MTESEEEEVTPRPAALIEALRAFGYSPATSVADLIDNSITAGATSVAVDFVWDGAASYVTVLDDGRGMAETELRDAMRPGSRNPVHVLEKNDLGRFGLGLKTASFSQARSLTVVSKTSENAPTVTRRWDLDHVGETNRWSLLKSAPRSKDLVLQRLDAQEHGTMVLWSKLDRLTDDRPAEDKGARKAFFATVDEVKRHLEMVFHRFIAEDDLVIRVNEQPCRPWDPFLAKHAKTERQPLEDRKLSLPDGTQQTLVIRPYVLPHRSYLRSEEHKLAAGPRGWNLQQGFYLYRSRRLIVAGDWFNPHTKPEEHHKLARIRVELTPEMDSSWHLDVRKSRARPPALLRDDFRRIASATREKAQAVYRYRGNRSVGQSASRPIVPVWQVDHNGNTVKYRINRKHELVKDLLATSSRDRSRQITALLQLIERNVPVNHILSQGFTDETKLLDTPEGLTANIHASLHAIFKSLCESGRTEAEARELLAMQSPFDQHPEIIEALEAE